MFRPTVLAAATLALAAAAPAMAQYAADYREQGRGYDYDGRRGPEIRSVADFERPLARYGRWVSSRFGRAWSPFVPRDWRPYTLGHWEETPDGSVWASDEPFGWATYHYGRWGFDDRLGWLWVPDTEWAPAWVTWRDGDEAIGWAPLPPLAGDGAGYDDWSYDRWYAPSWVYVPRVSFGSRRLNILPYRDNRRWWSATRYDHQRGPRREAWQGGRPYDGRPGVGRGEDDRAGRPSTREENHARRAAREVILQPNYPASEPGREARRDDERRRNDQGFDDRRRDERRGDPGRVDQRRSATVPPVVSGPPGGFPQDVQRVPDGDRSGRDGGRGRGRPDGAMPGTGGRAEQPRVAAPPAAPAPVARAPEPAAAPRPPREERTAPPQRQERTQEQREERQEQRQGRRPEQLDVPK